MSGIGLLMDGAIQQAAHARRHSMFGAEISQGVMTGLGNPLKMIDVSVCFN